MLEQKRLYFSDPARWEDKNDEGAIEIYREKKGLAKVFVLCCTKDTETIYHWKAFSETDCGCCVEFNSEALFEICNEVPDIKHGKVDYVKIKDLPKEYRGKEDKIPFLKRWPYRNESEYRILYEAKKKQNSFWLDIDYKLIKKVTVSQRLNKESFESLKKIIQEKYEITVNQSTVYKNDRWLTKMRDEI